MEPVKFEGKIEFVESCDALFRVISLSIKYDFIGMKIYRRPDNSVLIAKSSYYNVEN